MSVRCIEFERALKRELDIRRAASPELDERFRAAPRRSLYARLEPHLSRLWYVPSFLTLPWLWTSVSLSAFTLVLAVMGCALRLPQELDTRLQSAIELSLLTYPISDADYWRHIARRLMANEIGGWIMLWLCLAIPMTVRGYPGLGVLVSWLLLCVLLGVACTAVAARFCPRGAGLGSLLLVAALCGPWWLQDSQLRVPMSGWAHSPALYPISYFLAMVLGWALATLPRTVRALAEGFEVEELVPARSQGRHARPSETPADAMRPVPWAGVLEGWVARLLTPRQRVVSELVSQRPNWSRLWGLSCGCALLGTGASWLVHQHLLSEQVPYGLLFMSVVGIPFVSRWDGLRSVGSSTQVVPMLAALPVGIVELIRVQGVVDGVRMLSWMPLVCLQTAALSWSKGGGLWEGVGWGLLVGAGALVCWPAVLGFQMLRPAPVFWTLIWPLAVFWGTLIGVVIWCGLGGSWWFGAGLLAVLSLLLGTWATWHHENGLDLVFSPSVGTSGFDTGLTAVAPPADR